MLIYNGQIIAGGGTIVLPMTRAEYEANKAILDSADVWVDLTDEPDQVATAEQIAYWVGQTQKSVDYIGDIATKAVAKVEPTDTALYLHEVGEYFINKDGDACKVDLQIPVDGTITLGTNCHVLPKGVANDISSNLPANEWVTLNSTYPTRYCKKCGIVFIDVNVIYPATIPDYTLLGTLPTGFRPSHNILIPNGVSSERYLLVRASDGAIVSNLNGGYQVYGSFIAED